MVLRATQRARPAGLATAYTAAAAGDTFIPGAHTAVLVKNGSGAAVTVTIPTPAKVHDVEVAEISVSVPNGSERLISAPASLVAGANGQAAINYSAVAGVSIAVLEIV